MRYETTARDFFYETTESALTYYITCEGVTIYSGVAVKSPNEPNLRINVGRRVSDYLHTSMPDFRDFDGVVVPHPEQLREFILYDGDTAELERYRVLYEFGGEWNGDYYDLSFPIDGKADPRQKIFWGAIEEGEEVIVIDTESGSTTGSTTGCCENVPQFSYDLPTGTSFCNNQIELQTQLPHYDNYDIVSFSTDEQAQASGYPAAGYYLLGFTGGTVQILHTDPDSVVPIYISDSIGGRIETMADGRVEVNPYYNGKVSRIVAQYAEVVRVEGAFGTDILRGINADNASYVEVIPNFYDEYVPRTYYQYLKNLCFYNAKEVYIRCGGDYQIEYDFVSGNTTPVLESVELPNATHAEVKVSGTRTFSSLYAPKLKTGEIYLCGSPITGLTLPSFERNDLEERKKDPANGQDIQSRGDFFLANCTGITSADTIFGPNYKAMWGSFYGCTGIETFSSNIINAIAPMYEMDPGLMGICRSDVKAGTFEKCTSLREINLPALKLAGEWSFGYCTSLTYVGFPNLEKLGGYAFAHCENLTEVYLPKLENISVYGVFAYCTSLKNITIKFSQLSCGSASVSHPMFEGCTSLESVTLDGPIDEWYELFGSSNSLKTVVFTNIEQWGGHSSTNRIGTDIPESVTDVYFPSNLSLIATWDALNYPYIPITAIHYDGTKSQWNSILYSQGYPSRISVIHCTDGDIIP